MRLVVALGGNALLQRGQALTAENQRENARVAAKSLAELVRAGHRLIVTHGNGPQVGLLALQGQSFRPEEAYPLDVLGAETEGMIGYLIEQELINLLGPAQPLATLLTQVEVDPDDAAFKAPSKPIGPLYEEAEARRLAGRHGWRIAPDGDKYRRVVPSPRPKRVLEIEVVRLLVEHGVLVICAGGGGIPTVRSKDGALAGVEAVIDKDRASALLAHDLKADALIMLTDVAAVWEGFGSPDARAIRRASPEALAGFSFPAGSMGPKVEAACSFVSETGGWAAIGRLQDAMTILTGSAGTRVERGAGALSYYPGSTARLS